MGPQWGHGRYLLSDKALLGSRRCHVGAMLREHRLPCAEGTGRRALEHSPLRLRAQRGKIDHLVQARSGVGYVIEAETPTA
jgi:hypothetical protein